MKRGIDVDRIDPEFLMELSDPIEAVYEAIEHDLLMQLAKRFDGRKVPKSKVPGSTAWRAYMLEQIGGLSEDNIRLIAAYTGDVSELTQLAVRLAVETAIDAVEPELAKMVRRPEYVPERSATAQRVIESYAAQALNQLNLVNTVMLNSSLRAYEQAVNDTVAYQTKLETAQKALNEQTGAVIMGAVSRQKAVENAVKRMASVGLTGFTDAGGRNWSAQAYVQMDIRTTAANAARQAVLDRNEAHGNNLISVSSHPGARPLCAPYQGKVFSTDGTAGTVEDLHGKSVEYTPLSLTSYGQPAGLFGINCGHLPSPFIPGVSIVRSVEYSLKENAAAYEQTQQQRFMERRVRRLNTQADVLEAAGDAEGAKALRGKARQATADLMDWCRSNGRDFYPDRIAIVRGAERRDERFLKG